MKLYDDVKRIQMMTGTAAATLPTSSSVCMIFLMRACNLVYKIKDPYVEFHNFRGNSRVLTFYSNCDLYRRGVLFVTLLSFSEKSNLNHTPQLPGERVLTCYIFL